MPDEIDPERIRVIAEAARIPLGKNAPARIARAVTPTVKQFAAAKITNPFETEPASFILVQRRESAR